MAYISLQIGSEVAPDIMQTYASDDEIVYGMWFRRPVSVQIIQIIIKGFIHILFTGQVLVTC